MPKIFISYRREDSEHIAGRLYDRLEAAFGRASVFIDIDTIPFGVDFREYLDQAVGQCDIMLAVIGKVWLQARHEKGPRKGERRLDDEADFVGIEIGSALARNIPVIPVLVAGAMMPGASELPDGLKGLAYRNAAEVRSGRDFHDNVDRLIRGIEHLVGQEHASQQEEPHSSGSDIGASSPTRLVIGKLNLFGNYGENNQDALSVTFDRDMTVCVLADGTGQCGELASKLVVDYIPKELRRSLLQADSQERSRLAIRRAIVQANNEINVRKAATHECRNMATTVVLAVWRKGNEVDITSVGDSRAYRIRGESINQLTTDDLVPGVLRGVKYIDWAEVREVRYAEVLSRYLGSVQLGEGPEVRVVPLHTGDRILLCTDGLTGVVSDEQLLRHIRQTTDVQECADALGQLALENGSRDNVSCILIGVNEG